MRETTKSYLAGIIDGEAYIGIKRSDWGMRNRDDVHCPTYSERVQIRLSNLPENEKVLQILKDNYGGRLYAEKKIYQSVSGFNTNHKMLLYAASDRVATAIIKDVYPYLIIKKFQASVILKLRKNKESKQARMRGGKNSRRKLSKKILNYREQLWMSIKLHHKR